MTQIKASFFPQPRLGRTEMGQSLETILLQLMMTCQQLQRFICQNLSALVSNN